MNDTVLTGHVIVLRTQARDSTLFQKSLAKMTENPFADNLASSSSNNSDQVPLLDDPFSDHYQVADGGSAASEDGLEACSGCKLGGHSSLLRRGTTSRAYIMVGQRIAPDEEDRAEVEVLQARLEKTIQLTKKIKTSQTRLETSGSSVKEAIGPIYGNTQRLQVLGASCYALILFGPALC